MLTCQQLADEVSRFLEGELSMSEWAQIRVHLMMCDACRTYMHQMKTTRGALQLLDDEPAPADDVAAGLMQVYQKWMVESSS